MKVTEKQKKKQNQTTDTINTELSEKQSNRTTAILKRWTEHSVYKPRKDRFFVQIHSQISLEN